MGGSLGMAAGEAVVKGLELAVEKQTPFIMFAASGGARMQEGVLSLMQMPRTTVAVQMLREIKKPYIVVLTNPTTGGVTASYAMLGDIHIAEPGALIGFAGARVIEQTIREKLPEGFQRAEYLKEHGMVDMVVHRHEMRATLARLCRILTKAEAVKPVEAASDDRAAPVPPDAAEAPTPVSPGVMASAARKLEPLDAIQERLMALHQRKIDLTLDRMLRLLKLLDHPERRMAPVIHVAGTNGKGSTVAYLRAILEAAGLSVHVFTSPHLVRINERYRLAAGRMLVSDAELLDALEHCERLNADEPITVFEMETAAAFHLFAKHPADVVLLEVGLGGRGDSTNVIEKPLATVITPVAMDHMEMLGDTLGKIAAEKAGIIKRGVPLISRAAAGRSRSRDRSSARRSFARRCISAASTGRSASSADGWCSRTSAACSICRPPRLFGRHQFDNAGLAIATLRAIDSLKIPIDAYETRHRQSRMARAHAAARRPARWWSLRPRSPRSGSTAGTMRIAAAWLRRRSAIWKSACRGSSSSSSA